MERNRSRAMLAIALACSFAAGAQTPAPDATPAPASAPPAAAGPSPEAKLAVRDESQLFTDVPEPWRDYFVKARRAEMLDGRLERCLAYPDLPGTHWPAGYGAAHCRYHFEDPLPLAEIARFVDAGDIAGLEQRIRAIYSRHGEPDGEGAHRVFAGFVATPDGENDEPLRIAKRWVELAPKSGYAAVALGQVWRDQGWEARGSAFVRDTPPAALRRMETLHGKAIAEYHRAIALQPDLIDAYIGLVDIGKADGDDVAAFEKAHALDPGCGELAYRSMTALQPRWGGSRMAMAAYATKLQPFVAARPLLANQQSSPIADYIDAADREQRYTPAVLDLLDEAVRQSGEEGALRIAADVRLNIEGARRDPDRALAELAQIGRFNDRSAWADGQLGRFLVRRDPTWALRILRHGVQEDPGSAWLHYLLGAAAYNSREFEEAETHYLLASNHDDYSQDALRELSEMWLMGTDLPLPERVARAQPFIDRLLVEHPDDGRGLFMRMLAKAARNPHLSADPKEVETFLARADLSDPWQKSRYDEIRRGMTLPASGKAPGPKASKAARTRR